MEQTSRHHYFGLFSMSRLLYTLLKLFSARCYSGRAAQIMPRFATSFGPTHLTQKCCQKKTDQSWRPILIASLVLQAFFYVCGRMNGTFGNSRKLFARLHGKPHGKDGYCFLMSATSATRYPPPANTKCVNCFIYSLTAAKESLPGLLFSCGAVNQLSFPLLSFM
jgi:hypothetical protein